MASIADLCWTTAEDLMRDIDLDSLYLRQLRVLGGDDNHKYPYLILIFTGKITIGINLSNGCNGEGGLGPARFEAARVNDDASLPEGSF
jgi:hypothetical protein